MKPDAWGRGGVGVGFSLLSPLEFHSWNRLHTYTHSTLYIHPYTLYIHPYTLYIHTYTLYIHTYTFYILQTGYECIVQYSLHTRTPNINSHANMQILCAYNSTFYIHIYLYKHIAQQHIYARYTGIFSVHAYRHLLYPLHTYCRYCTIKALQSTYRYILFT
jgi:hypothetical protein